MKGFRHQHQRFCAGVFVHLWPTHGLNLKMLAVGYTGWHGGGGRLRVWPLASLQLARPGLAALQRQAQAELGEGAQHVTINWSVHLDMLHALNCRFDGPASTVGRGHTL